MGTEKENNMETVDRSNSSTKYGSQQNQSSGKNRNDPESDKAGQESSTSSPKRGEQDHGADKKKYEVQGESHERNPNDNDGKKDVERELHPEEHEIKQKEYKKEEQKFNDKSVRA